MGVGNGMSSGLVMTLGADLAPPGQRPVFLGVWRMFADAGNGVGPFVIAGITAVASLGVGIAAMGGVALLGGGWLGYWIPRRVPQPQETTLTGGPPQPPLSGSNQDRSPTRRRRAAVPGSFRRHDGPTIDPVGERS